MKNIKKTLFFFVALIFVFLSSSQKVGAAASTFTLVPSSGQLIQGCNNNVEIRLSTGADITNAADIIINYDPSRIEIIDAMAIPGVQIQPGNVYESYFGNQVNTSTGEIRLTGASFSSTFTGTGAFAYLPFKTKPGVTSASFSIYFTGAGPYNSLDSNIADSATSNDLLVGVTNATYTFVSGSCATDNTPPTIVFDTPQNNETGVPVDSNVQITISDTGAGVDLNTVEIVINGVTYEVGDPGVTYSGTPASYTFIINPTVPFPEDQASTILVRASDLVGNQGVGSIIFNIPGQLPGTGGECPEQDIKDCVGETIKDVSVLNTLNNVLDEVFSELNLQSVRDFANKYGFPLALLPLLIQLVLLLSLIFDYLTKFFKTWLLGTFIGKGYFKGNDVWGGVYASANNKPIKGALVILASKSGEFISAILTNDKGEYGFDVKEGDYLMRIVKNGWDFPSLNKVGVFSGLITVAYESGSRIFYSSTVKASRIDIFLDPDYFVRFIDNGPGRKNIFLFIIWNVRNLLFILGFFLSLMTYLSMRTPLYLLVVLIYIIFGAIYLISDFVEKRRISQFIKTKVNN